MMTTAPFRNGDKVTLVSDWDQRGTIRIADLVVYSCGTQRMILVAEGSTEAFEGRNFAPVVGPQHDGPCATQIHPRMAREDAIRIALAMAETVKEYEHARFTRCIAANWHNAGYVAEMRKCESQIHEARVVVYVRGGDVEHL